MEQTRLLLAILLTFLVFVAWEYFFSSRPQLPVPQEQSQQSLPADQKTTPAPPPDETVTPAPPASAVTTPTTAPRPGRLIDVETPLYTLVLGEAQARFNELILKEFKESVASAAAPKSLIQVDTSSNNMRFGFQGRSVPGLENAIYTVLNERDLIKVQDKPEQLSLGWTSSNGIEIVKTFTFYPDSYLIDLEVAVTNRGTVLIKDRASLAVSRAMGENQSRVVFEGPSGLIDGNLKEIAVGDIEEQEGESGLIEWIGVVDRYFMSALMPHEAALGRMEVTQDMSGTITNSIILAETEIAPGQRKAFIFKAFYGPKNTNLLKSYGHNLVRAINFGWFDFLAKPALWFMNLIYSIIPNYGIAIILLTVMTKIILWPLGNKSYKSMNEMKRMQPLMAEIREKHKDDKKKMNEEMMGLYRTYKINPMGGCLPMLVQLPVFLALYNMLYGAIELRHAPFVGWINDLSTPDRLFNFGFSIPLMEPPYGIPVLTVIMGATMFLQQKMSPPPGDPAQAKIMLFLPLIFTFIFINFPAGLVLYWLVNNILSIAQQYYIQKKYA